MWRAKVVFPTCRGPKSATAGASLSASTMSAVIDRENTILGYLKVYDEYAR
jgi:hypothetical protein